MVCGTQLTDLQVGVKKKIDDENCLRKVKRDDQVEVKYTGKLLADGTVFDSNVDSNRPFAFSVGVGQVIKGWDQGLLG